MTIPIDSQNLESYVPVYDVVPEKWDEARPFIVEQLKKLANAINVREIGYYLDQELLSGKSFIPGMNIVSDGGSSQQFRTILRIVVDFGALSIGLNSKPHGVSVDANFSLIQLYAAATNATALTGEPIPNGSDTITYDAININITVAASYSRCWAVMEYIQEL
jgi:hypothetical protein